MSKKLLVALFMLGALACNASAEESFIRVNPKLKIGKVENGNHFFEKVRCKTKITGRRKK